jgi:hypothetical protein
MAGAINGTGGTPPAGGGGGAASTFRAADALQNGRFTLDFENNPVAKAYGPMLSQLGETTGQAVARKVEDKMTAWINAHPGADQAAFDAELRKTLQIDTMQYKMVQDSINKMMKQIEDKMKEMAADRFG